jgi:chromosome segregation ATPase
MEHQSEILEAYEQHQTSFKKTWEALRESLPQLGQAMTFATFKQYLAVYVALFRELQSEHTQQLSNPEQENLRLMKECSQLKEKALLKDDEMKREHSQLSGLSQKVDQLSDDLGVLRLKVNKLETSPFKPQKTGRNIAGWTVRLTSKGYYHLCKSFGGSVKSIYLGKVLDEQKARQKIKVFMSKLG